MKNLFYIAVLYGIAKILKFLFEIGTSFFIGKAEYGIFAILISIVLIGTKFTSFGMQNILIREFPRQVSTEKSGELLFNACIISFLLSTVVIAALLLLNLDHIGEYPLILSTVLTTSLIILCSSFLRSKGNTKIWIFYKDIVWYILYFIGLTAAFCFYENSVSLKDVVFIYAVSVLVNFIIVLLYIRFHEMMPVISAASLSKMVNLIKASAPVLMTGLTFLILSRVDVLMLSYYVPLESVGEYNIVSRVVMQLLFPYQIIISFFYPALAKMFAENKPLSDISIYYTKYVKLLFASTIGAFLFLYILVEFFNVFVYFNIEDRETMYNVLYIFSIAYIIYSLIAYYGHVLLYIGKQHVEYYNNTIILSVGILLNLYMIPSLGVTGAALASAIAIVLGCVIQMVQVKLYTGTFFMRVSRQ